jgi:hypothetical protein
MLYICPIIKKKQKMRVPNEAKLKWDSLKEHGDIEAISEQSQKDGGKGYGRHTIAAALNGNDCTIDVFSTIQSFYNEREKKINGLVNPNQEAA